MKIIYNSIIRTHLKVGDKIKYKEWGSFYVIGQVYNCERRECSNLACRGNNPIQITFEGFPQTPYCSSSKWVYENENNI